MKYSKETFIDVLRDAMDNGSISEQEFTMITSKHLTNKNVDLHNFVFNNEDFNAVKIPIENMLLDIKQAHYALHKIENNISNIKLNHLKSLDDDDHYMIDQFRDMYTKALKMFNLYYDVLDYIRIIENE